MKRLTRALIIIAASVWPAFAQTEEPLLSVKVAPSSDVFKPGQSYPLALEITIRSPYHINSQMPSEDYLIGTTVDFKAGPGVTFSEITFPPAEMRRFSFSENPLAVYEGTIKVTAKISLAADIKGDSVGIAGTVGYQACNDQSCLPPDEAEFTLKVPVAKAAGPADHPIPAGFEKEEVPMTSKPGEPQERLQSQAGMAKPEPLESGQTSAAGKPESRFEGKGLLPLFLLVFLGGLALNLTPCVYPLMPITIGYFGGQCQGKKGGIVLHAVLYVIGMAVTYSVLGSIAAFTGSLFGAALQYPAVLIFIAAVMVLLSLSMFDVYELRMPAALNRLAGGSQKGRLGSFLMGLTVGIVAAPCIGPFVLGLLTYVGDRGSVILGFSLFFVLALGLGVPLLVLGIFSGSLNKLPRSGAWMVWVRKIFGFVLIAMAIYFLKPLLASTLLYHLALALTALVAGFYLAWLEPTRAPGKAFLYVRTIVGVILFGAALFLTSSGVRAYFDEKMAEGRSAIPSKAIAWEPYSEAKLEEALASGRPVIIDSYAEWCIPCKEMDKLIFSRPQVIAASREFAMLRADVTSRKDPKVKGYYKKFNVRGVPTTIFLKPDGSEIGELRGTGFESKDVFLAKMKRALELSKE
jgi:thiol:disulfide interchange protein DsbD